MTALNVLRVMAETGRSLADLAGELQTFPQVLVNVRVREKRDWTAIPPVAAAAAAGGGSGSPGAGRLLVRYSGTEPLLRVMIEGRTPGARSTAWAEEIAAAVRAEIWRHDAGGHAMRLGVNIDHIATIRQARKAREPEPVAAAVIAELAGAEGITVHLRGDRRHIQDRDVEVLREVIGTRLNIEMAATPEMIAIASRVRPWQVTLVPEQPEEVTTTGGLDVVQHMAAVQAAVAACRPAGIRVSIFVDTIPGAGRRVEGGGRGRDRDQHRALRRRAGRREAGRAGAHPGRRPSGPPRRASRCWPATASTTSTCGPSSRCRTSSS